MFTETYAKILWGVGDSIAPVFAQWMQASCSRDAYQACYVALESYDASHLLARVSRPALVVHNRNNRWVPAQVGQRIAASIPGARLQLIDDIVYTGVASAIRKFVDETGRYAQPTAAPPSGTAVILFADIADSTGLTERLGDAAFRERARGLDAALRAAIRGNGGTPIEGRTLGDGVLAVFASARQAIEAALACAAEGGHGGLPLHVGLHAGDVIREEGNVYGGAVNVAARVAAESAPGEVLVSQTVRDLARTSAGVSFEDRGERELKGVSEPVRVWRVREGGE